MARQCFLNEYVYPLTESEAAQAIELKAALGDKINAAETRFRRMWLVTVGAYFPLHDLSHAWSLRHQPWPQCVDELILQQIAEPAEEHEIAALLPHSDCHRRRGVGGGAPAIRGESLPALGS